MRPPKFTALPARLGTLLERLVNVTEYPVPTSSGLARCHLSVMTPHAPDPHDWWLWKRGTFVAFYEGRVREWSLQLRRCPACDAIEVREVRDGPYIPSDRPGRRVMHTRSVREEELLGWYQGSVTR